MFLMLLLLVAVDGVVAAIDTSSRGGYGGVVAVDVVERQHDGGVGVGAGARLLVGVEGLHDDLFRAFDLSATVGAALSVGVLQQSNYYHHY